MTITFPGANRVDASWDGLTVTTDQDGSAPDPFAMFLASIGTCAGVYVAGFCRKRGIEMAGIRIRQRMEVDPSSGHVRRVELDVEVPASFPEQYRASVVRAADLCKVKRHLEDPPEIVVRAVTVPGPRA
jgi:ribosomal protein S12 methylthiotransferase accessory factor